jgi:hypothetical protein
VAAFCTSSSSSPKSRACQKGFAQSTGLEGVFRTTGANSATIFF